MTKEVKPEFIEESKSTREKGCLGEKAAREYLSKNGYKILQQNYKWRRGEIDLIAEKQFEKKQLVFIEVKARASKKYGLPCQAVDKSKIKKLEGTVKSFLQNIDKYADYEISIDVIEIYFDTDFSVVERINHIKNITAF